MAGVSFLEWAGRGLRMYEYVVYVRETTRRATHERRGAASGLRGCGHWDVGTQEKTFSSVGF